MTIGASASSQKSSSNNKIDPKSLELFNQTYQPGVNALSQVNTGSYGGPLGAGLDAQQLQGAGMAQANAGVGQSQLASATGMAQNVGNYQPQKRHGGAGQRARPVWLHEPLHRQRSQLRPWAA